jgi:hypothetical protein
MSKVTPALRSEVDGMWYFEEHPEVAECFKQVRVFTYCKKLSTFHQQIAKTFALSYDGRVVKIGKEEQTGLDTLANLATTIIDVTDSPAQSTKIRRSARIKTTVSQKA